MDRFVFVAVAVAHRRHRGAGHYLRGGPVHHEKHQEQRTPHLGALNTTTAINGNEALCNTSVFKMMKEKELL